MKKILIVTANYYKDISLGLLNSAKKNLPRNFNIKIIKSLHIKNMILVTRSRKKVVGLDGYGIKIAKQEILK